MENRAGDFGHLCTREEDIRQSADTKALGEAMKALFALLTIISLLLGCACSKREVPGTKRPNVDQSQEVRPDEPLEPLTVTPVHVEAQPPENFLHTVFSVSNYTQFSFVAPPHQDNTRLHGTFRSFIHRNDPNFSDSTANVDVMLLNDREFNEFLHGPSQSVTREVDSAHNQTVDWQIPRTYGEPQTYHLVFSNSGSGAKTKFVEADFTVSF
jgi:hypothetical protein